MASRLSKSRNRTGKKRRPPRRRPQRRRAIIGSAQQSSSRRAQTDRKLADTNRAMAAAVDRALSGATPAEWAEIRKNPKLVRMINEEAAVRAAAEYGVNIRRADGKIDMKLARRAAEVATIEAAAEMGFDIRNSSGGIDRKLAYQAAKAAESARSGGPATQQVRDAVSRRDAMLVAHFREAERLGHTVRDIGGDHSRTDAYDDAELADLIRGHLTSSRR